MGETVQTRGSRLSLRLNLALSAVEILRRQKIPKPVFIPYTGSPVFRMEFNHSLVSAQVLKSNGDISTSSLWRATLGNLFKSERMSIK
jgi:hypothetical protein